METNKITFVREQADLIAKDRFISTCGFDLNKTKHQKMMKMGLDVLEAGKDGLKLSAKVSYIDGQSFRDHRITIGNMDIFCNFFEQIPDDAVEGMYFYVVSAGECLFSSEENIMDFLYADIWGTSYVDATTVLLKDKLTQEADVKAKDGKKEIYISEEFGPGYFGMPVIETKKFVEIVGGEDIGVWTKDSGLMIPQKSCSGVFLLLNRKIDFEPECMKCQGNSKGCQFCRVRQQM